MVPTFLCLALGIWLDKRFGTWFTVPLLFIGMAAGARNAYVCLLYTSYYDKESDAVLYSDSEYMYTYKKGENVYTDDTGKTYNTDYSVVVESEGKC